MPEETRGAQISRYFRYADHQISQLFQGFDDFPEAMLRAAKEEAVRHHAAHFHRLPIRQTSVCPYKIVCWYGFALSRRAHDIGLDDHKLLLRAIIAVLSSLLRDDNTLLPGQTTELLWEMTKNHGDPEREDFAIGPNGLYASFLTARMAYAPPIN